MSIAIAGYGLEGAASYRYYTALGHAVTILDERTEHELSLPTAAKSILGPGVFDDLAGYDKVIRTAGLSPKRLATATNVWSSTNEFFAQCPAPIIGVTGTKGKGTTASMIAAILSAAGRTVHLLGNIGTPSLDVLPEIDPNDLVVFELSSFQLWDLKQSPHVAVVLMIEPDHLDVHSSFEEYLTAKANIGRYQSEDDTLVFNATNRFSTEIANQSPAKKISYPFYIDEFRESLQVTGNHNVENASAAIAATREYIDDPAIIRHGLESFSGLSHRLKFIVEKNGIKYYDDSISTTPGSAIAALRAFSGSRKLVILGGSSKGASYDEVVKECAKTETVVIAVGETGVAIQSLCDTFGVKVEYVSGGMKSVVQKAQAIADPGDIVILSPASASFDQYKNYADRGDQFIAAVNEL